MICVDLWTRQTIPGSGDAVPPGAAVKVLLYSLKGFPVLPFRSPLWVIAAASGAFGERALSFSHGEVPRGRNAELAHHVSFGA